MTDLKVGFRTGIVHDQDRPNWSGNGWRPIRWSAWYPAAETAIERPLALRRAPSVFVADTVLRDAALDERDACFPVVLLSHGTGGSAISLGWLAHALAAAGHVVIGVDHHGNTASESYQAEGFLCWWERPRDLSVVLDALAAAGPFSGQLDLARVVCAGFSLGGHTALAILGGVTEAAHFQERVGSSALGKGPREFPDLSDNVKPLLSDSKVFRASWERQSESCRDQRVRAAVALAPGPPVRAFTEASLAGIVAPVTLMAGEADREAPAELCAAWLDARLSNGRLHRFGDGVGHYTFLSAGTDEGKRLEPEIFDDAPNIDRHAVHRKAIRIACSAIDGCLSTTT